MMFGQFNDDTSHDAMRNSIEMTITVARVLLLNKNLSDLLTEYSYTRTNVDNDHQ